MAAEDTNNNNSMEGKKMFKYPHRLPPSRLGTRHESLASYLRAVSSAAAEDINGEQRQNRRKSEHAGTDSTACGDETILLLPPPTQFSLVVILFPKDDSRGGDDVDNYQNDIHDDGANSSRSSSNIGILLGKKLRGFGSGFYNCFGGKLESTLNEYTHPAKGAIRELEEECGIKVSLEEMEKNSVGKIHFTFEDQDVNKEMLVHLFCVVISLDSQSSSHHANTVNGANNSHTIYTEHQNKQPPASTHHNITSATTVRMNQIRGCDEIEPILFHNIHDIPLHTMFADDSIWLTMLLDHYNAWYGRDHSAENATDSQKPPKLQFDARFHFHVGGTETNSIMHYYIQVKNTLPSQPKRNKGGEFTLEQRLFHALHSNNIHSPSIKEFKENWAMANAVRAFMKDDGCCSRMEYVLDVAGGHGALAALFLLLVPTCHTAVVIDPAECNSGKFGVREAWKQYWSATTDHTDGTIIDARTNLHRVSSSSSSLPKKKKELRYRHECLRTGLRKELYSILHRAKSTNVTIVACHACQHLTDETLQIASEYGVNVAVMPCCQKDHDGWWKSIANGLVTNSGGSTGNLTIGALMDILAAGKMMSWGTGLNAGVRYRVKMKLMDKSISKQNRMILCKAMVRDCDEILYDDGRGREKSRMEVAHAKLTRAYHRAHRLTRTGGPGEVAKKLSRWRDGDPISLKAGWCGHSLLVGVCVGAALTLSISSLVLKRK